jgi:hypothetical protein
MNLIEEAREIVQLRAVFLELEEAGGLRQALIDLVVRASLERWRQKCNKDNPARKRCIIDDDVKRAPNSFETPVKFSWTSHGLHAWNISVDWLKTCKERLDISGRQGSLRSAGRTAVIFVARPQT